MNYQPNRNTWPELLYRFIEHYKWEPQHLQRRAPRNSRNDTPVPKADKGLWGPTMSEGRQTQPTR